MDNELLEIVVSLGAYCFMIRFNNQWVPLKVSGLRDVDKKNIFIVPHANQLWILNSNQEWCIYERCNLDISGGGGLLNLKFVEIGPRCRSSDPENFPLIYLCKTEDAVVLAHRRKNCQDISRLRLEFWKKELDSWVKDIDCCLPADAMFFCTNDHLTHLIRGIERNRFELWCRVQTQWTLQITSPSLLGTTILVSTLDQTGTFFGYIGEDLVLCIYNTKNQKIIRPGRVVGQPKNVWIDAQKLQVMTVEEDMLRIKIRTWSLSQTLIDDRTFLLINLLTCLTWNECTKELLTLGFDNSLRIWSNSRRLCRTLDLQSPGGNLELSPSKKRAFVVEDLMIQIVDRLEERWVLGEAINIFTIENNDFLSHVRVVSESVIFVGSNRGALFRVFIDSNSMWSISRIQESFRQDSEAFRLFDIDPVHQYLAYFTPDAVRCTNIETLFPSDNDITPFIDAINKYIVYRVKSSGMILAIEFVDEAIMIMWKRAIFYEL